MSDAREQAIEAGARAWLSGRRDNYVSQTIAEAYETAETILAAVEPIIRADEQIAQVKIDGEVWRRSLPELEREARETLLADLRAKVDGLEHPEACYLSYAPYALSCCCSLASVLAMLDEGSGVVPEKGEES
jgi:hypothetical protein